MQRLGKNQGRYRGEQIQIGPVLERFDDAALKHGWRAETFLELPPFRLRNYHRPGPPNSLKLYLSTGVHGDEPSGPLAALQLIEENDWPSNVEIWFCPCVNPTGFELSTRENAQGIDLNRDYRHVQTAEVRAHVACLEKLPRFDLCILLHEDWEANGFYLYELNPHGQPSLAGGIIEAVRPVCPIEHASTVDNWPASGGIIRPTVPPADRPLWAEALYLIVHKCARSYTLETPSDFPLRTRVEAHVRGLRGALRALVPSF